MEIIIQLQTHGGFSGFCYDFVVLVGLGLDPAWI